MLAVIGVEVLTLFIPPGEPPLPADTPAANSKTSLSTPCFQPRSACYTSAKIPAAWPTTPFSFPKERKKLFICAPWEKSVESFSQEAQRTTQCLLHERHQLGTEND